MNTDTYLAIYKKKEKLRMDHGLNVKFKVIELLKEYMKINICDLG